MYFFYRLSRVVIWGLSLWIVMSSTAWAEGYYQFDSSKNYAYGLGSDTTVFIHTQDNDDYILIYLCEKNSEFPNYYPVKAAVYDTKLVNGQYVKNNFLVSLKSYKENIKCDHMDKGLHTSKAMKYRVSGEGVYAVELNGTDHPSGVENQVYYKRWDFYAVGNNNLHGKVYPSRVHGNIFSYKWSVKSPGKDGTQEHTSNRLYSPVPGGFENTNYVWALDLQEIAGEKFNILANAIGVDPAQAVEGHSVFGKSVPIEGNSTTEKYPLYLSYPKRANPAAPPRESDLIDTDFRFEVDDSDVLSPDGDDQGETGEFSFSPNIEGTYTVTVDTNLDGVFDSRDTIFYGEVPLAENEKVIWDGTNNEGAVVPNAFYQAKLDLRIGEYHVVLGDVETSGGGSDPLCIPDEQPVGYERVDSSETQNDEQDGLTILQATLDGNLIGTQIYWDDETFLYGSSILPDGVGSNTDPTGQHRHTWGCFALDSGLGNDAFIDTYTYGRSKEFYTSLTVAAKNDPPSIEDETFTVSEDSLPGLFLGKLTAEDVNGDLLKFSIISGNPGSIFMLDGDSGEITLNGSLDADTISQYQFEVEVTDLANTAVATVTVNVSNINEPPIISGVPETTVDQESEYEFVPIAEDPDGDELTFSVLRLPSWAQFSSATGAISGTPGQGDVGVHQNIVISVSSTGFDAVALPPFDIEVIDINIPPEAADDSATVREELTVTFAVLNNDIDKDGDVLTVENVGTPANGSATLQSDNMISYTPDKGFVGTDSFVYSINDGHGESSSALVTVEVTEKVRPDQIKTSGGGGSLGWSTLVFILGVLIASLLPPGVSASSLEKRGKWFLYGDLGSARGDSSKSKYNRELQDISIDGQVTKVDDDRSTWDLGLGYRVNRWFSVELGYADLNDIELQATINQYGSGSGFGLEPPPSEISLEQLTDRVRSIHPESGKGMTYNVVADFELSKHWNLMGKFGYFDWRGTYKTYFDGRQATGETDSGFDPFYAIGVRYQLSSRWDLALQWRRFDFSRESSDDLSLGVRWYPFVENKSMHKVSSVPVINNPVQVKEPDIVDTDQDGVNDDIDACPNTAAGVSVDESGCKLLKKVNLKIEFKTASYEVPSNHYPEVEALAFYLKEEKNARVLIKGHTDNVGSKAFNLDLSLRRARAVEDILVRHFGIDVRRVTSKGFGESEPVADNTTPESRARNRRVMAVVIDNPKE